MENYYWLEGPLPGDNGRRILVLHSNQEAQCSHCLKKSSTGCPGMGNGKACEQLGTPRGKMFPYMQSLRARVGYASLKTLYMENQVKNYPALTGGERATPDIVEDEDMITPMNPIELKDKEIENLNKKIEESKTKDAEINHLKDTLTKTVAELKATKRNVHISQQKLNFTKRATEQVIVESISDPKGFIEDPVLIGVYSATLNEDEIDIDDNEDTEDSRSRCDTFLKSMKEKIDPSDPQQLERYNQVKNKILEKVKASKSSRSRSRSVSSVTSTSSKRLRSGDRNEGSSPVRPRPESKLPVRA